MHQKTGIASFNMFAFDWFLHFFLNCHKHERQLTTAGSQRLLTAAGNLENFQMAVLLPTKKFSQFFFFCFFGLFMLYMILDTCLLISLQNICCLFIDMVDNADDDLGDQKPSVVDSVKVVAPVKVEASVKVEAEGEKNTKRGVELC